jgi:hypothetical protein
VGTNEIIYHDGDANCVYEIIDFMVVCGCLCIEYCGEGEVAYMVFSQKRDLRCVDIGATKLRVHGLLQRLVA